MIPHAFTAASKAKTYLMIRSFLPSKTNSLQRQRFRYGNTLAAGGGFDNSPIERSANTLRSDGGVKPVSPHEASPRVEPLPYVDGRDVELWKAHPK